ncbi:MAG TPA: hypothetical protein PL098_13560, partial [Brevundimonas diminuta]|nr:hypothetical protein [Brevundimonas diminuta]
GASADQRPVPVEPSGRFRTALNAPIQSGSAWQALPPATLKNRRQVRAAESIVVEIWTCYL